MASPPFQTWLSERINRYCTKQQICRRRPNNVRATDYLLSNFTASYSQSTLIFIGSWLTAIDTLCAAAPPGLCACMCAFLCAGEYSVCEMKTTVNQPRLIRLWFQDRKTYSSCRLFPHVCRKSHSALILTIKPHFDVFFVCHSCVCLRGWAGQRVIEKQRRREIKDVLKRNESLLWEGKRKLLF